MDVLLKIDCYAEAAKLLVALAIISNTPCWDSAISIKCVGLSAPVLFWLCTPGLRE